MEVREFFRRHLMIVFIAFIGLQLIIFGLFQSCNHKPVAVSDNLEVIEGRAAGVSPLNNDVDKDEKNKLTLVRVSQPHHGTVIQKKNVIRYIPNKGFTGKDSCHYTVTDGKKESRPAFIVFHVIKNQAPVVNADYAAVFSGGTTEIFAIDNDADKEKDSLIITEITEPLNGNVRISENRLYYTATNPAGSADSFFYSVSDGKNISKKTPVRIKIHKTSDPGYPWLSLDIGEFTQAGKIIHADDSMTITASGTDIWNNADGFYFTCQMVNGDFEISARVESLEGPHEWTKSGLMVRENLSAGSKNVFIGVTAKNGITSQARTEPHESSDNGQRKSELKAPYWLKLSRQGDSCKLAVSPDGKHWQKMDGIIMHFPSNTYVGVAVTSHDNKSVCKTTVSNLKLKGKTTAFKKL